MIQKNYVRMQKYFQVKLGIKANALEKRLSLMDAEDVKILYARWGVEDGKYCNTFGELDKKLNINNSKTLYISAKHNLQNIKFALMLRDYDKLPLHDAINLGILGCTILRTDECSIYGEKLLSCIKNLPADTQNVIKMRFGLDSDGFKTRNQIASISGKSSKDVEKLETFGLRQLNNLQTKFLHRK